MVSSLEQQRRGEKTSHFSAVKMVTNVVTYIVLKIRKSNDNGVVSVNVIWWVVE